MLLWFHTPLFKNRNLHLRNHSQYMLKDKKFILGVRITCSWNGGPTIPKLAATSRTRMHWWESKVWLRPSRLYTWLNPVKASTSTLRILTVRWGNLLILQLPQTSHKPHLAAAPDNPYKFPCSLNLRATSLEWSASFFCLSLPSVHEGQFANQDKSSPDSRSEEVDSTFQQKILQNHTAKVRYSEGNSCGCFWKTLWHWIYVSVI